MTGTRRPPLTIFKRTFLLLLAALLVAQAIAVALVLYAPARGGATELARVASLLASDAASANPALTASTASQPPSPAAGSATDDAVAAWLAHWLEVDRNAVSFASSEPVHLRGDPGPPDGGRGPPPESPGPMDGPPPGPPPPDDMGPRDGREGFARLAPDTVLHGDFVAALRLADGRWRVVESAGRHMARRVALQVAGLSVAGLALLLPLAWWFSRALSAPIRRFARAAEALGRNPDAPPVPDDGPSEIAQAAQSFNTMQGRVRRLVAERTHMVGAIAHDLRTPLARLAFRLQALPPGEQEKAQADIDEMKAMISAALEFLRDRSAGGERKPLDLRLLVESVVEGLSDIGRDVVLEPGPDAVVEGDPIALRRVVSNLVDNALKYGARARVRIVGGERECRLEVDDDGPGIDPSQAERLFTPFVRGEQSRNRETGGIGLGLSVVQDIVTRHGGHVALQNRGDGLRAVVVLPVC